MELNRDLKLTLLRGDKVEAIPIRGFHISSAIQSQLTFNNVEGDVKLDIAPFLMCEVCLINNAKKDIHYFIGLISDDYISILEYLSILIEKIK